MTCISNIARPQGYKTFFMLSSNEQEIINAHKLKNIKKFGSDSAQISLECFFPLINFKNYCWHFNIYEQENFHAELR